MLKHPSFPVATDELLTECRVLGRQYGAAQVRCSRIFEDQRRRIAALEAELLRTRGALVVATTKRQWEAKEAPVVPAGRY